MNSDSSRLEFLPNELLINFFQYLQAEDLFQAFYNLNSRLNSLLKKLHYLSLTPLTNHSEDEYFFPYIGGLIINRAMDVNLSNFSRIRFLILRFPTEKLLDQLNGNTLPYLEHLRLNHMYICVLNRVPELCKKVFSNIFPSLISCYLFQWGTMTEIQGWTYSSLRVLKVGIIDLLVYKSILSICPNLYFFQLATLLANPTPWSIIQHQNLKRMIIKTTALIPQWKDEEINTCLSYVHRLEYLSIHRTDMSIPREHDWFVSVILNHLPFLSQFHYYVHLYNTKVALEPVLNQMQEDFQTFHQNYYQSRLIIN